MKYAFTFLLGILVTIAVPLIFIATGFVNMDATQKPSRMEHRIGNASWERSLHRKAPQTKNPFLDNPSAIDVGFDHYKGMCVTCHGAPGVEVSEIGKGLNPAPPKLRAKKLEEWSDGELFYLIKNGIRMTGMPAFGPTHSDDEIWKIAAFMRHLDSLSAAQTEELRKATTEGEE